MEIPSDNKYQQQRRIGQLFSKLIILLIVDYFQTRVRLKWSGGRRQLKSTICRPLKNLNNAELILVINKHPLNIIYNQT